MLSSFFKVFKAKYAGHRFIGLFLDLYVRPLENAFEITFRCSGYYENVKNDICEFQNKKSNFYKTNSN